MPIAMVYKKVHGHQVLEATLLDAAVATGNGEWVDCSGFHGLTVDIEGITTASVSIRCSNNTTRPANSEHEREVETVTADGTVVIVFPVRWLKARVSSYTSGTITANLYGNSPQ